eukprot:m.36297 g.36297  ORF g.36297 m.36297 type:complete len:412 (-) comp6659_c0_seq1:391-1626(-)
MSKRSKKKGKEEELPDLLKKTLELSKRRNPHTSPRSSPLLRRLSTFIKHKSGAKKKVKHSFHQVELTHPTWCDYCDDLIWGLLRGCVKCPVCMTTCHGDCADKVCITCKPVSQRKQNINHVHPRQAEQGIDVGTQGLLAYLTAKDVRAKIHNYNTRRESNFIELLDEDDVDAKRFKGFLRVTLNLTRPIRVSNDDALSISSDESSSNPSLSRSMGSHSRVYRTTSSSGSGGRFEGDTSFFIPKPVSKGLFVTSASSAQEVIGILLKKFQVTSNPRKFALFEKNLNTGTERRLRRFEEPLALQLLWGDESDHFVLSLKEHNSEYEFPWEEFSLVELENFLTILNKEEQEAHDHVKSMYVAQQENLNELLKVARGESLPPSTPKEASSAIDTSSSSSLTTSSTTTTTESPPSS